MNREYVNWIERCARKSGVTIDRIERASKHVKVFVSKQGKKGIVVVSTTTATKGQEQWGNVTRDMRSCLK